MFGAFYSVTTWILYPVFRLVGLAPTKRAMSEGLTDTDKAAIRRTWAIVGKDPEGNGIALFMKFFSEFPYYQDKFSKLKGLSQEELKTSSFVKMHASRVVKAITEIVDNLDNLPELVAILEKNMDSHFGKGIIPDHYNNLFNLLVRFMAEALEDEFDQAAMDGWVKAAGVMVGVVKSRYTVLAREEGLLPEHKVLIRGNWALVGQNAEANGIGFFLKLFRDFPVYQEKFPKLKGLSEDELKSSAFLKRHAMGVVTALTSVVDNLDNVDVLVETMEGVVTSHIPRKVTMKHYNNLFVVLLGFLSEALGDKFTPDHHVAWTRAATVLLGIIEVKQTQLGGE